MKKLLLLFTAVLCLATCKEEEPQYLAVFYYGGVATTETQPVREGSLIAPPSSAHPFEGAQLIGWSERKDTVIFWNFTTDVVGPRGVILHAYYRFPVIFDYQGKAVCDTTWITDFIPTPQPHAITAPAKPAAGSYIVDGWYKDAGCTRMWYSYDRVDGPTRLYAKWADAYTVSYNTQGGSEVSPSYVRQNGLLLRPEKPTNSDDTKLFFGWYKEPECTNLWDFHYDKVNEHTTLYARWYSIASSGMDFPIHMVTCEGKSLQVLKEDLPGRYTWTKDGEESNVHYNPCPEGWDVPTINELHCFDKTLAQTMIPQQGYWSREVVQSTWGQYFAKYTIVQDGEVYPSHGTDYVNWRKYIRCIKYD
jgi:hypothetical protein